MSCFTIKGGNNPGNEAHVNTYGELQTHSVILTEESKAAERGELFNLASGIVELTNDVQTPLVYLKNEGENRDLKLRTLQFSFGPSTGAAGLSPILYLHINPTAGTIISNNIPIPLANYNVGSGNQIDVITRFGGVGSTITADSGQAQILVPTDAYRDVQDFDSVVVPRGRSIAISAKAPTGNTSMNVSVGIKLHLKEEE